MLEERCLLRTAARSQLVGTDAFGKILLLVKLIPLSSDIRVPRHAGRATSSPAPPTQSHVACNNATTHYYVVATLLHLITRHAEPATSSLVPLTQSHVACNIATTYDYTVTTLLHGNNSPCWASHILSCSADAISRCLQ